MAEQGSFFGEVQRGAKRFGSWFWGLRWRYKGTAMAVLALIVLGAALGGGEEEPSTAAADPDETAEATNTPEEDAPTETPEPTSTPAPTDTPEATATPTTPPTPTPTPEPVVFSGSGQDVPPAFTLPFPISVATFTHSGNSNFIVHAFNDGDQEFLINEIGRYSGSRPLIGTGEFLLNIDADGAWTVSIVPIGAAEGPDFSGTGDAVSGLFDPPAVAPFDITHTGSSNFVIWLQCDGGSDLVQNEIGAVSGRQIVQAAGGSSFCFWEVEADGTWSIAP